MDVEEECAAALCVCVWDDGRVEWSASDWFLNFLESLILRGAMGDAPLQTLPRTVLYVLLTSSSKNTTAPHIFIDVG
jgi:hypothetical protein